MPEDVPPPAPSAPRGSPVRKGKWVPHSNTPLWFSLLSGVSASATPVLLHPAPTWNTIAAAVLAGLSTGATTYFAMKSAGTR